MIAVTTWSIWSIISVTALIILWCYYNLRTYRQEGLSARLVRRSIFYFVGLLGIALLILRPAIPVDQADTTVGIFTAGATADDTATFEKLYPKGEVYKDVNQYLAKGQRSQVDTVHLYGVGPTPGLAELLSQEVVKMHRPDFGLGIERIEIPVPQEYKPFSIEGRLSLVVIEAEMTTPQGESIELQLKDKHSFSYNAAGLAAGRYLYNLQLKGSNDSITIDIPVEVNAAKKYSVLVLLSAPSFEANYFKNYWSELGHSYAQRIKISNYRYTQTFINRPKVDLIKIENSDLKDIDFVMADVASWNNLSDTEQNLIKRKTSVTGATLFIIPQEGQTGKSLPTITLSSSKELSANIDDKSIKLNGVAIREGNWQKIKNAQLDIAYKRQYGIGHVGYLPIENSYKMLLSDMNNEYQSYWANLLSAFYINTDVPYLVDIPKHVWESDPTLITIHSRTSTEEAILLNDSVQVNWINNPMISNNYKIEIAPSRGWNKLQIGKETPYYFYGYPDNVLSDARYQRNANALTSRPNESIIKTTNVASIPIAYWWGYALALIGLGLFWLDERL